VIHRPNGACNTNPIIPQRHTQPDIRILEACVSPGIGSTLSRMAPRPTHARIIHATHLLDTEANVWVSTASPTGVPHLVPLSLAWHDDRILVATPASTPTARNVAATGKARAALDSADDVVLVTADATEEPFASADSAVLNEFVNRVGWNPATESGEWSLLVLTPQVIQAWQGPGEINGRTIMKNGEWLRR
jgi:hypothetical protein